VYLSGTSNLTSDATPTSRDATPGARNQAEPQFDGSRILDVLISAIVLVFVAPLMLGVAIGVKLQDGGPILFGHQRIGFGGRSFRCWKFRSMVVDAESRLLALLAKDPAAKAEWDADHKLRKDPRVTAFGRFLRVSSLDELPQLLNVLAGEMSLVGPRPIVTAEVARYGRWFKAYTSVRPGITGLWQISGRNDVSYRERVAMDVLFARKRSVGQYLRILIGTIPAVLGRSGSY
jgi:exopolysaccharide production protein ExoY